MVRRGGRSFVRSKRENVWVAAYQTSHGSIAPAAVGFSVLSPAFTGYGAVGVPTMNDVTLVRSILQLSGQCLNGHTEGILHWGLIKRTLGPGGTINAADVPSPAAQGFEDWIQRGVFMQVDQSDVSSAGLWFIDGSQSTLPKDSRNKRKMGDQDVILLVQANVGLASWYTLFSTRLLFNGARR